MKVISIAVRKEKRKDQNADIDVDFESGRRNDVKHYIEERFGHNNVCSIGTYSRLKTKSALKDFGRAKGLDFDRINYATKEIPDEIDFDWADIFTNALESKALKSFVQENIDICEIMKCTMGQSRSSSVHASAVIIVPKYDDKGNKMEVFDWLPVKIIDGNLISEWEGKYIDAAGFLKEDILGIAQLDKFKFIINLVEKTKGIRIDLNEIPTDDKRVFKYFTNGWNEDVFQFGTYGLKAYTKKVKPHDIEDLISVNAIFRPGPMKSHAHNDFVMFRNGTKKAVFDIGMEKVTEKTQGLYIYQEQIMQSMVVAGLSLVEADQVRTTMKKFDKKALDKFKVKFIAGYSKVLKDRGFKKDIQKEAERVWEKLFAFSSYGFNKSHSSAYSLMGYWSQWLKVNYPLEFWTVSLNFSKEDEEVPNRISEIKQIGEEITIAEPDVNKSNFDFVPDPEENKIYWSLKKIKNVGAIAVNSILEERANGEFFSLEDFVKRVVKSKVNKRTISCLIMAGAFDNIGSENLNFSSKQVRNRYQILKQYLSSINSDFPEDIENSPNKNKNWFWRVKQRELTGFGDINFSALCEKKWPNKSDFEKYYFNGDLVNDYVFKRETSKRVIIAGVIDSIAVRKSVKGEYCVVNLRHNNSFIHLQFWNDHWANKRFSERITELSVSKDMFSISGVIKFDSYRNKNVFFADSGTKIINL